jgi:beta-phosphoglucomutase-like phosphatase (HAD superfamily)
MALATSASRRRVESTLVALDLGRYFQTIVTGDEVDAGKPDPAIYRLASARLHEAPGNLLAVEDAVSGVKSATAAGMKCIGVANARRAELLRAAGADPVVPDFRALSLEQLETKFARDSQKA